MDNQFKPETIPHISTTDEPSSSAAPSPQHTPPSSTYPHKLPLWLITFLIVAVVSVLMGMAIGVLALRPTVKPSAEDVSQRTEESLPTNIPTLSHPPTLLGPTSTPMPFSEMTIPALRTRAYKSTLGERKIAITDSMYTGYEVAYDSDGYRVNGLLMIPTGTPPKNGWPAIVFVHGYIPPSTYNTLTNYVSYAAYLARSGIVVYKIDLRGHGTSEGEAYGAYQSETYVVDTLNAYAALTTLPDVDKSKIGLWGHSMAGNITFRSMVVAQTIPKVVIWAGAVYTYEDQQAYGIADNSYRPPSEDSPARKRRAELTEAHGQFSPESDFWRQVVPTNYLDGVTTTMQFHHAVDDAVVSIEYTRNVDHLLTPAGIKHTIFEYPSGGHNLLDPSFSQAMKRSADFLKE